MQIPQFLNEEFVDNTIFNAAMTQVQTSIQEVSSDGVFLIPGVINPSSLLFTFNSNLTVTVNAQNTGLTPFKCLFNSGAITDAHGIIDGTDSQIYTVNFTSLIPGVGSITAYVVAQYTTVQEGPTTIIGAPPGHPDYSANFVPYIGYTRLDGTLNIFATITAPDNLSTIELGRTTLTAGQTVVSSISTANQVVARVNAGGTLSGDVTGPIGSNIISFLQGKPVSVASPSANTYLGFNGTTWIAVTAPASLPPSGPAGGDLSGTYPNPTVAKIQGMPVKSGQTITAGKFLVGSLTPDITPVALSGDLVGSAGVPGAVTVAGLANNPLKTSVAPLNGQVPTYVSADSQFEFAAPVTVFNELTSPALGADIDLTASFQNLISVSVTFPSTGIHYRVFCEWNLWIQFGGSGFAGVVCQVTDGSTTFGFRNGTVGSAGGNHDGEGVGGNFTSNTYNPGQTVTFTLQGYGTEHTGGGDIFKVRARQESYMKVVITGSA